MIYPDRKVQCTRCRNIHLFKDRVEVTDRRRSYCTHSSCPCCNGRSYYMILKDPQTNRIRAINRAEWDASWAD